MPAASCTPAVSYGNSSPNKDGSFVDASALVAAALPEHAAGSSTTGGARGRIYYVDWLRVFLTVLVLVHHCVCTYTAKSSTWIAKNDTALWLLCELFVVANQAYFMSLFFFLSGLYVPASYNRKGPANFLLDRTLRLVVPCLFYSFLAPPFIIWWNQLAKNPAGGASLAAAFRGWLKPGWPTTYILPTGPPWFIWMLWCFNVAYVILVEASNLISSCRKRRRSGPSSRSHVPRGAGTGFIPEVSSTSHMVDMQHGQSSQEATAGNRPGRGAGPTSAATYYSRPHQPSTKQQLPEYTTKQMIMWGAALTVLFFTLCYSVRVLDQLVWQLPPAGFVQRGPFVSFMPDFFVVYAACFALGTFSHPRRWDVLRRLPHGWAGWLLACGGVWWTLAGFVPNVALHSAQSMRLGLPAWLLSWLLGTWVEQSFAVVWSAGLLILFRDALNGKPNWVGRQIIGGAYGAYIVHPLIIVLFGRALMSTTFPSVVVNATAMAAPVVFFSWLIAVGLRALPGAKRVL